MNVALSFEVHPELMKHPVRVRLELVKAVVRVLAKLQFESNPCPAPVEVKEAEVSKVQLPATSPRAAADTVTEPENSVLVREIVLARLELNPFTLQPERRAATAPV